jgi:hypothetical protein
MAKPSARAASLVDIAQICAMSPFAVTPSSRPPGLLRGPTALV